ncbi:enoyl-CoA hydratase-related protein [Actinomadura viridis]|uniref:Enoyl-CoA hydratase/carnithine racemase n=1 Tax=Actinomadura viridis TaxID=58110 RepID=A0A931DUU1_9ACTN|nr:enoyl-CoA hydratase/isomerase family protein [Actinomadura viridis]MBG6093098.1 enoyl-CoA hydratase/carnithine racemase [Actinomadura viridis]
MAGLTTVRLETDGPVALLTLARPAKLNAMSRRMVAELTSVLEGLAADARVRCVVLAGEGRMFSAGADLDEFRDDFGAGGADPAATEREARDGARLAAALESPDIVTIAAVHGAAIGGAAAVVAACGLRLFADDARLLAPELAMGLPLAWGGVERLVRDLGPAVTRDLLLTGRPLTAEEAVARGFAMERVAPGDLLDRARRIAALCATRPRLGTSIVLGRIRAVADRSRADGVDDDAASLAAAARDPEALAAARAYLKSLGPAS